MRNTIQGYAVLKHITSNNHSTIRDLLNISYIDEKGRTRRGINSPTKVISDLRKEYGNIILDHWVNDNGVMYKVYYINKDKKKQINKLLKL